MHDDALDSVWKRTVGSVTNPGGGTPAWQAAGFVGRNGPTLRGGYHTGDDRFAALPAFLEPGSDHLDRDQRSFWT
jgi:hypothetical protein